MSHTPDSRPAAARSAVAAAPALRAAAPADPPPPVVPAQPAPLDFAGFDDAPFEHAWPPLTAWWMLGGDGD